MRRVAVASRLGASLFGQHGAMLSKGLAPLSDMAAYSATDALAAHAAAFSMFRGAVMPRATFASSPLYSSPVTQPGPGLGSQAAKQAGAAAENPAAAAEKLTQAASKKGMASAAEGGASLRGPASESIGMTDGEAVKRAALPGLILTICLGVVFTACQAYEYYEAALTMSDGYYGSAFYTATGFHGLHVIIGTTFLFVCALRMARGQFAPTHHVGFQLAAWYWHFVDVVWLFVLITFYDF